jgi:post-segregation antitoxin (ccd killing protein)
MSADSCRLPQNRTSVYLPRKLRLAAKEAGLNISKILREAIEAELYADNPKYLEKKYANEKAKLEEQQKKLEEIESLKEKAEKVTKERAKRLTVSKDELYIFGE